MKAKRYMVAAAGLSVVLAVAPATALHAQTSAQDSAAHRTWNVPTTTAPAPAPGATAENRSALSDTAFVREASAGNLLEVRLGNLAAQRASSSAVKQFAERMVADHTTMGNQWAALVSRTAMPVRASLDANQQQTLSRLTSLSGANFDRAYMNEMVQDHRRDIDAFQHSGPQAKSADVRQLAASSLATMRQHLTMAQQVADEVGGTAVAADASEDQHGKVGAAEGNGSNKDVRSDADYIKEVATGHLMEVQLAQMAKQKATDKDVRQFADRMLTSFTNWRGRWEDVASKGGVTVNQHLGPKHQEKVDRLEKASHHQFDRVYLDIVRENLASVVPYFEKEGRAAKSAQVRDLVEQELPMIQQHLDRAKTLEQQAQASAKAQPKDRSLSSKE